MWAPLLCTAVAPTWIRVLRGVGDQKKAQPGCCRKPHKGSKSVKNTDACWVWSLDGGILCLHGWRCVCIRASKSAPGCVHLCMCSVFDKGEGLSAFNYSTVKTLHVHSRASHPTYPDTLLRGSSWRKQTKEDLDIPTSWAVPLINSSSTTFQQLVFPLMQCTRRWRCAIANSWAHGDEFKGQLWKISFQSAYFGYWWTAKKYKCWDTNGKIAHSVNTDSFEVIWCFLFLSHYWPTSLEVQ